MNAEGHKSKAEEIERSLQKLLPDSKGKNVVAIVELVCGIVQHLIAYGLETKYVEHNNKMKYFEREDEQCER
ncbi:hypothetical protein AUJ66_02005 [Candidatus Desantisbacteria bacterium CG1_02_38_46]|uniref:Uncharacterized protein n=1 Tax=Candidatus Desantisbacteria bacterium CG1_02_38_46 TaxID=1817893 RepID=A0A1J4SIP0_9BACT|nr:MAG: hypothetical protein AUJ66_02005 [Candidatus Desantisbacteria bacterium CG1_02_38_46]